MPLRPATAGMDALHAEQVRQLYSGMPVSLATTALLAMLLAYVQSPAVGAIAATTWLVLIQLSILGRARLYLSWRRLPQGATPKGWLQRFRFGAFITGILWGVSAWLLFPPHNPAHQATLAFALAGVTAAAMVTYSMDMVSALGYITPLLLPLMLRLFAESSDAGLTMSAMTLLFLLFLITMVRRQHVFLLENVSLRLQADTGRTSLMQKDAALNLLTERLTALIEAIPDAIFFKDGNGRWLITNEMAKNLFRLHGFDWRGKTEMELAQARPEFRSVHEACMIEDEKAWKAEKLTLSSEQALDENGVLHDFEVRKMPLFDSAGARRALVVIGRDVTERRAAERELRIAAAAFEVQEGVFVLDASEHILRVNSAFTRLTGYGSDEVIGKTLEFLQSKHHDSLFYQQMQEKVQSEGVWQGEVWQQCKDGSPYPHWLTISTIKGTDGVATHYIGTFSDISQFKEAEAAIHTLAYFDQLTSLPNRRLLLDRLQQALASSMRRQHHGAVLFIDLDNFKTLNDTRGHAVGDLLLVEVAQRLSACVRAEDTVARLGGDEFVVILEGLSEQAEQAATYAEVVGEKVLDALNQPYLLRGFEHHSTPSIGVSLFLGEQEAVEDLLKHADAAMYQAKQSGRNAIRFFDPVMQVALETRIQIEHDLRQCLPQQQLLLYYQIQVDQHRKITGAEVLLRWLHPQRGMVSPVQFIPVAEDSGLIVAIGFWVLETACTQLKRWEQHEFGKKLELAVNVSARQFRQRDFAQQVQQVLQQTGANPRLLKLELTESLVLDNVGDTIEKMHEIKALGVRFSMDDFGTGQSSLGQLKRLPLDQLKIDQSFVRDMMLEL